MIASLLELGNNSYALIDGLCQQSNEWQDFAEDFEEVEEFFTRQFDIWQQLRRALNDQFKSNRHALEQNREAAKALAALQAIYDDKSPYSKLRQVGSLIDQLIAINLQLVEQKRATALEAINATQQGVEPLVADLPAELQNQAMRPFNLLKERISNSLSLHEIVSLQQEADDEEDKVLELINRYSAELQARREAEQAAARKKAAEPPTLREPEPSGSPTTTANNSAATVVSHKPIPKPIELVSPAELLGASHIFIETEQDIDTYLATLRSRLQRAIGQGKRVRIK
ncbi:MAG: hypothetical protein WA902_01555 [Thermosynechococcaceae cyanobacterium]